MAITACSARLGSSIAHIRMVLLCFTQIKATDVTKWAESLQLELGSDLSKLNADGVIRRAGEESDWAIGDLRFANIINAIISFSSTTEYFIKDIIHLCLQRSSSLRKQAFSAFEISALMIEHSSEIDEIKLQLFKRLSSEYSKGGLFKDKIKKASTFLSLDKSWHNPAVVEILDSFFSMRNHIAHNNTAFLEEIKLSTGSGTIVLKRNCSNEEFAKFTIEFIALLNHSFTFLSNWDKVCLGKWKSDDFVPKHKSE